MDIDLRRKEYRRRKNYWRGVKEGCIPLPRYTKPVITAIKLDPKQAILVSCQETNGVWVLAAGSTCLKTGIETQDCAGRVGGLRGSLVAERETAPS